MKSGAHILKAELKWSRQPQLSMCVCMYIHNFNKITTHHKIGCIYNIYEYIIEKAVTLHNNSKIKHEID